MSYTKIDEHSIKKWLEANLSDERYLHSIGTAECAKILARQNNIKPEKAYVAGLLHDAAKCFSFEELHNIAKQHLKISKNEMENKKTLHAPVSAYIAKNEFGVTDKDILSAIRWHTIGKINMNTFEKIIFIADKIEPITRDISYTQDTANLLLEDNGLNKAILDCYKKTIISLVERNLIICPVTIDIYNDLQSKISS